MDREENVLTKQARREAKRQAKEEQQRLRAHQQRLRTLVVYGGLGIVAALLVGLIVWSALRPKPGQAVASQGQVHISPGQPHPSYNSNPPTSGWHSPQPAGWGYYNGELPDELVVHNLEHGGVWISFKSADDTEVINKLVALSQRYRSKVIITLRPKNDSRIAVTAWQRILKLDGYDEAQIVAFIDAWRNRGPERVP